MAERTPMVKVDGYWQELPSGDTTAGAGGGSSGWTITAKTADYTVLAADNNTIFTNTGGFAAIVLDIDSTGMTAGEYRFGFFVTVAAQIRVAPGGAGLLDYVGGSVTRLDCSTFYGYLEIVYDGTDWIVVENRGFV